VIQKRDWESRTLRSSAATYPDNMNYSSLFGTPFPGEIERSLPQSVQRFPCLGTELDLDKVAANEAARRDIGPDCTFVHTHRGTAVSHQPSELDSTRCTNMDTVFGLNTWTHTPSSRKAPRVADVSAA
jgi:hypothetical protein